MAAVVLRQCPRHRAARRDQGTQVWPIDHPQHRHHPHHKYNLSSGKQLFMAISYHSNMISSPCSIMLWCCQSTRQEVWRRNTIIKWTCNNKIKIYELQMIHDDKSAWYETWEIERTGEVEDEETAHSSQSLDLARRLLAGCLSRATVDCATIVMKWTKRELLKLINFRIIFN